ncbi:MAG: PGF-CTERM sorting domain-containing protein, partial [Methanophagales archaeon]|nr:PGF-CTERM sorting domain-containing protein [Methanophagales archaeon]
ILEFDVDKDAAKKKYQQGLEIRCVGDRDLGDDNVYTFDKQIQMEVTSSSSGNSSIPGFEALVSFIALLLVFFFIARRKKGNCRNR